MPITKSKFAKVLRTLPKEATQDEINAAVRTSEKGDVATAMEHFPDHLKTKLDAIHEATTHHYYNHNLAVDEDVLATNLKKGLAVAEPNPDKRDQLFQLYKKHTTR